MKDINVLIIEDEQAIADQLKTKFKRLEGYMCSIMDFDKATQELETTNDPPNVIVLDLMRGSPSDPEVPGEGTYKIICDKVFCPIVVYSADPDIIEIESHPFTETVRKGSGSDRQVVEAVEKFKPHIKALHKVQNSISRELMHAMREVAPYAFEAYPDEREAQRNDMMLRAGRRRLAAMMDDLSIVFCIKVRAKWFEKERDICS